MLHSAVVVVAGAEHIHGLEQLVQVHKGTHNDQRADKAPQPVGAGVKAVGNVAADKLGADTVGDLVEPHRGAIPRVSQLNRKNIRQ